MANKPVILIVDDEKVVRDLVSAQLSTAGYEVITAPGGREALRHITDHQVRIDLLITDVLMPFMNGRELATRVSVIRPRLRVLFISAYSADILSGYDLCPDGVDFVRKPFRTGEIATRVERILKSAPTWREIISRAA
jgi:CheY-like chemotaxis protein